MPNWRIHSNTLTSGGDPRQFFDMDGEVFVLAAERVSGGDDSKMPRRVIATGSTRASARRSLEETISRYDSLGRLLPSR